MNVAVILAGGKGSRMKRKSNKVLEQICGKPIISYIVDALLQKNIKVFVVIGENGQCIKELLKDKVTFLLQPQPLGTGHALKCACNQIEDSVDNILVLNGDGPIFESDLIDDMIDLKDSALKILVGKELTENRFGRIIRKNGEICNIIEAKDCSAEQLKIQEINLGIYCFNFNILCNYIAKISRNNAQNEYYVTDLVNILYQNGFKIDSVNAVDYFLLNGVNTLSELNKIEMIMRNKIYQDLESIGVRLIDKNSTYIDVDVIVGAGSTIYPNTYICGKTIIGENVTILPNCFIKNCIVHDNIQIGAGCIIENKKINKNIKSR